MPLEPLSKKVVGEQLTVAANPSKLIIDPFNSTKPSYAMKVKAVGPLCCEVKPGDVVLLPPEGWTIVTLLEDDSSEPVEMISVREDLILAVIS